MSGIFKIMCMALFFLLVAAAGVWAVEVGEPAPDFTIRTFDNTSLSRTVLAGKPLMLVFWNTWCPDCMRELPEINRIAEKLGRGELTVLAVNTGLNDSESKARAYWKKYGYVFPVGFDHSFEIGQAFRVIGVPTVFLIDSKGIVRYKNPLVPGNIEERIMKLKN
jgi:peroxiredoxin